MLLTKKWIAAGFLLLQVLVSEQSLAVATGDKISDIIKIDAMEGQQLNASTLQGKVTLVNFWATWCAACKVEIKEMEEKFKTVLGNRDFQLAFVSLDKDPAMASAWMKDNTKIAADGKSYLYKDPEFAMAETLGVDSFPMTIIIGKDGKIVHVQKGFEEGQGSTDKMVAVLNEQLGAK